MKILSFILLFLLSVPIHGQDAIADRIQTELNKLDTARSENGVKYKVYKNIAKLYNQENHETSKTYHRLALAEAKQLNNTFYQVDALTRYANRMIVERSLDSAKYYQYKAYDIAQTEGDTLSLAKVEHSLGFYYAFTGNYSLAQEYYEASLRKFKAIDDTIATNNTYVKFALLYSDMEEYEKAIEIYEMLLLKYPKRALFLSNIANAYNQKDDTLNTISYYEEFLEIAKDKISTHSRLGTEAIIHRLKGEYKKEGIKKKIAYNDALSTNRPILIYSHSQSYAEYLIREMKQDEAIEILESILIKKAFGPKPTAEIHTYKLLKDAYSDIGNFEKAFEYSNLYSDKKADLIKINNIDRVIDREKRLEAEKQRKTIALLQDDQEKSESRISILLFSILTTLVLLLLSTYLFIKNKRINKVLKTKNDRLDNSLEENKTLLQETHHRVKNNLQIISSLLNLQRKYTKDDKINDILNNSRNRVKSMALIHQMLYQGTITKGINAKKYITTLSCSLLSSFKEDDDRITFVNNIEDLNLHEDTINPIGLIINEIVTNCIKYAFPDSRKGEIAIDLYLKGDILFLNICDDGIGLSDDVYIHSKTFGFSLVQSLSKKLNAEVLINNKNGTCITLHIRNFKVLDS